MDARLCILNIGAHPADLIDDAGGTCIHHADRGDRIVGVTLTHGARVHDKVLDQLRTRNRMWVHALPVEDAPDGAVIRERAS